MEEVLTEIAPVIRQLWQCPRCETYCGDEIVARNHCGIFSVFECGSGVCEHQSESKAAQCYWRVNPERFSMPRSNQQQVKK